jgi:hypothetical protein
MRPAKMNFALHTRIGTTQDASLCARMKKLTAFFELGVIRSIASQSPSRR